MPEPKSVRLHQEAVTMFNLNLKKYNLMVEQEET